jgi:hypothetical protein
MKRSISIDTKQDDYLSLPKLFNDKVIIENTNVNDFTVITLDNEINSKARWEPGFSDEDFDNIDQSITSVSKLSELLEKRVISGVLNNEVIISKEKVPRNLLFSKYNIPIDEKNVSREFLLVTHQGLLNHMTKIYQKWGDNKSDKNLNYTKHACFHEVFYTNNTYKIFIDIDYKPSKITTSQKTLLKEKFNPNLSYPEALNEIREITKTVIGRLETCWKKLFKYLFPSQEIRFIVYDSSNISPTDETNWKISTHLIWYVEGVRFTNRNAVVGFLTIALSEKNSIMTNQDNQGLVLFGHPDIEDNVLPKSSNGIKKRKGDLELNGMTVIDAQPYYGPSFRMPYCCKLGSSNNLLPTILKPINEPQFMDSRSFSIYNQFISNNPNSIFCPPAFLIGLINYIDDISVPYNTSDQGKEKVTSFIHCKIKMIRGESDAFTFDESVSNLYGNENTWREIRSLNLNLSNSSQYGVEMLNISMSDHIRLLGKQLTNTINQICDAYSPSNPCIISLHPRQILKPGDHEIILFRCLSHGKFRNACLAREFKNYQPHKKNNNFIILNIVTKSWYMCCHNVDCIRHFLNSFSECEYADFTDEQILSLGIKAKSKRFKIDPISDPIKFALLVSLANKMKLYTSIQRRKSNDTTQPKINQEERSMLYEEDQN